MNLPDERDTHLLSPDISAMLKEFKEGKPVGESGRIEPLADQFSWKKSFVNCWTGDANAGKTTLLNTMTVNKSKHDNWKWCIWSPEMISSQRMGKVVTKSAGDIYDELIHAYTGKNPYKHFVHKYGIPQMSVEEYMEALEWVQGRFYVISPTDKHYKSLIDSFNYWYEKEGFDGWVIDPFKNIRYDQTGTTDNVLHHIFDEIKDISIYTDTSVNIVAHPRSTRDAKKPDGSYKVVTQFDLLGGSAWNNSMDGIFSAYRPFSHKDPNDPSMWLYHLKQRKKHLVGDTGVFKHIEYVPQTNRHHFDGTCPIDGSFKQPIIRDSEGNVIDQPKAPPRPATGTISFEPTKEVKYDEDHDKAPF